MSTKIATIRARVKVTLDVDAGSVWGENCELTQIIKQAKDDVTRDVQDKLRSMGIRLLEPLTVTVIVVEEIKGEKK